MCNRKIKHSFQDLGITHTSICTKPDYKDGLCKKHYDASVSKKTNWVDKPGYRQVTEEEFNRGVSMKLCNTNQHILYYKSGSIIKRYCNKIHKRVDTDLPLNYKLFCKKL